MRLWKRAMKTNYDAIIVGAGPAGMACSSELANRGLEVAILDEQAGPGGQIYRNITGISEKQRAVLGPDYLEGLSLLDEFQQAPLNYLPKSRVWQASANGDLFYSREAASTRINAPNLVICTGAMERPVPFPGWTLPGVMTCGGMSNLYKDSGLIPSEPTLLAGSGPFLWLVAEHLLELDAPVVAIFDTTPLAQLLPALQEGMGAIKRLDFMMKGVRLIADVYLRARKKKIPIYRNVKELQALGKEELQTVKASCGSKELSFNVKTLLVTEGIIPNVALQRQAGCTHTWDPVQRYHHPELDQNGCTSLSSVYVAGDGGFVHGAKAAEYKGRLTALYIIKKMRRIGEDDYQQEVKPLQRKLAAELVARPFIDKLYAPRKDLYSLKDDTVICRCEGVTAGRVRSLISDGYRDHNEIKAMIRCGMGPCQGRMCGSAVLELIAESSGINPAQLRQHRLRPPIKPVSLQELANAQLGEDNEI